MSIEPKIPEKPNTMAPQKKSFLARLRDKGWKEGPEGWIPPPPRAATALAVPPAAKARRRGTKGEGMNSLEARYADEVLEAETASGTAFRWFYESFRLRLAPKTFYTPDFMVLMSDGTISFREVKGFLREDAAVKFKWARELYPFFEFRMVARHAGSWKELLPPPRIPKPRAKNKPLTRRASGG